MPIRWAYNVRAKFPIWVHINILESTCAISPLYRLIIYALLSEVLNIVSVHRRQTISLAVSITINFISLFFLHIKIVSEIISIQI